MADNSFNPEIDAGLGKVSEVTREQVEQFQEQLRAAQAALAALQKEESQAKKKDFALAGLLNAFLQGNSDTAVLQLVVKCLEMGIPVNVIVGILSIAYADIEAQLAEELKKVPPASLPASEQQLLGDIERREDEALAPRRTFDTQTLPDTVRTRINEWVRDIIILSLLSRERTLTTVYAEGATKLVPVRLCATVLQRYLDAQGIDDEQGRVQSFAAFVLGGIGKELSKA